MKTIHTKSEWHKPEMISLAGSASAGTAQFNNARSEGNMDKGSDNSEGTNMQDTAPS